MRRLEVADNGICIVGIYTAVGQIVVLPVEELERGCCCMEQSLGHLGQWPMKQESLRSDLGKPTP
ncbi:hypothetical protein [Chroococcidiopsis sp. CCMEE 29]|uniref:hypothetical protein n=1 Tax=Chroococcidiopsis sp. CCMEE 29 TaxID=155894 RepID=UPI002021B125|nr:hypothetical protein [Chroococcidiopsis sp. CCMEE 29]